MRQIQTTDDNEFLERVEEKKPSEKSALEAADVILSESPVKQDMEKAEKVFIAFVTDQIQKMDQKLLFDGSAAPTLDKLNYALSSHAKIMLALVALYEQNRWDKQDATDVLQDWMDVKYVEVAREVNTDDKAKNKWLSKDEIERLVRVKYRKEYSALHTAVNLAESKRSFLQKSIDLWNNYGFNLGQLSRNSIAELTSSKKELYEE